MKNTFSFLLMGVVLVVNLMTESSSAKNLRGDEIDSVLAEEYKNHVEEEPAHEMHRVKRNKIKILTEVGKAAWRSGKQGARQVWQGAKELGTKAVDATGRGVKAAAEWGTNAGKATVRGAKTAAEWGTKAAKWTGQKAAEWAVQEAVEWSAKNTYNRYRERDDDVHRSRD